MTRLSPGPIVPAEGRFVAANERTEEEISSRIGAVGEAAGDIEAVVAAHFDDEAVIRQHAYAIWEAEGRPLGRDVDHWHRARSELGEIL